MAGREQHEVRRSSTNPPFGRVESVWIDRLRRLRGTSAPHRPAELSAVSHAAAAQAQEASVAARRAAAAAQGATAADPLQPAGARDLPRAPEAAEAALRITVGEAIRTAATTEKAALDIQAVLMSVQPVGGRLPERCRPYEGGWIDRS